MTWVVATTYRRRVSPGSSKAKTGGLEMSILRSSSALYVSFIQWEESDFFNNLYRGPMFPQLGHETAKGREA
jgi:hypothetical protein